MSAPARNSAELVAALVAGAALGFAAARLLRRHNRSQPPTGLRPEHVLRSVAELRSFVPSGAGGSTVEDAKKMRRHLDAQMIAFVRASPFLQLATADAAGLPFVSPKGDAPGFVEVVMAEQGVAGGDTPTEPRGVALLLPDRPGNRLLFGLQNVVGGSGRVGLLFEIPGNHSTLRCGGRAALTRDPALLQRFGARGRDAKAVLRVEVEYAFFHCAKAYMRSRLWEPSSWPPPESCKVRFGAYFAEEASSLAGVIDAEISEEYAAVGAAVAGVAPEPDNGQVKPSQVEVDAFNAARLVK